MNDTTRSGAKGPAIIMVAMMVLGYTLNFMDRQIVSVLVEPIKAELHLTDGQVGVLTGMSFALFYAVMGLPIAALSDRYSRKWIIVVSMTVWSLMTVLFGLAKSYPAMFVARMAVGVAEAGFAPAAFSMIADYFPREQRGTATGAGAMGAMLGSGLGILVGGQVAQQAGWRAAMTVAGAPGLIVALLFAWLVSEPPRGQYSDSAVTNRVGASAPLSDLWRNSTYLMVVGSGMSAMCVLFAYLQWLPAYLVRTYQMTGHAVGTLLGPLVAGVGAASLLSSGYLTDVLSRRDPRWGAWIPAVGALAGLPLFAVAFLVSGRAATLSLFSLGYFAVMFFSAPNTAMIQQLVPPSLRARATALFLLMTTLVGFGFGPVVAGYLSEAYLPWAGRDSLRFALLTLTPILLISPVLLSIVARRLKQRTRT